MGLLGAHERAQQQQKQKQTEAADQFIMQSGQQDPAGFAHYLTATPEGQKWGKRHFGEGLEMATGLATARANHAAEIAKSTAGTFGGGGGGQGGVSEPTDIPGLTQHIKNMEGFMAGPQWDQIPPEKQKTLTDIYNRNQTELGRLTQEQQQRQEFDITKNQQQQQHQESDAIRLQGQQIMAGLHQDTLAMQQQNAQFMHQIETAREDDQRQAHFQTATQSLASQTSNIAKMLNSATPADPNTVKTLLNARNAQARALKQAADKNGIEYDPEQFKPLTTQTVKTWGGLSSSTSLAESPDASGSAPNVEDFVKKYGGK